MSFLHLSLLAGLAAITVPIMLHLFGQRQPQLIDFPALRFVRETTQEQSSSWQLRHILLLLLRILMFALLAFALARPRVHSAMLGSIFGVAGLSVAALIASVAAAVAMVSKRPASIWLTSLVVALALWISAGLWGFQTVAFGPSVPSSDQSAPIAAAIIVDNGPTSGYQSENRSRLDAGKEMATWILDQLPVDSRVGVLTSAPIGSLALDPSTAKSQVKLIEPQGSHVNLLARIRTSLDLVVASELERKEVYVITDLTTAAWESAEGDLAETLSGVRDEVLLQIIDIGQNKSFNWALGDPENDFDVVPAGGDVAIEVSVQRVVDSSDTAAPNNQSVTVELLKEAIDPRLPIIADDQLKTAASSVVDRKVIDLSKSNSGSAILAGRNLEPGTHNFTIRIDRTDPLAIDNQRFVTVVATEQQPTLIVADDPALALQMQLIADPSGARDAAGNPLVETVRSTQLPQVSVEKYAVICLLDPPPLSTVVAQRLKEHVLGGGGLLTILGPQLGTAARARTNAISEILPGEIGEPIVRSQDARGTFLDPVAISHPIFSELAAVSDDVPWSLFPVFRNWNFTKLEDDAITLIKMSDNTSPAVIARQMGQGQTFTFTTPIPAVQKVGQPLWNEIWIGDDPWPGFALLLGTMRSLSGAGAVSYTYESSEPVSLPNEAGVWPTRYELFLPQAQRRRLDASDGLLTAGNFEAPGIYRLRGQLGEPIVRGFSVNTPAADTNLQRVGREQLDTLLGEGNYRFAADRGDVESSVGQARFGRELYPLLMLFVAGVFLAEQAMSNRFYKIKFRKSRGQ